jgi:hypothetical protein
MCLTTLHQLEKLFSVKWGEADSVHWSRKYRAEAVVAYVKVFSPIHLETEENHLNWTGTSRI